MEEYNKKIRDNYSSESSGRVSTLPPLLYYVGASTSAIYAVPSLGIDPATGTEFFRKLDGTVTQVWDKNDMVVCGDFNPDVQGTFGINVAWRGIYLNAGFKYAYGGQAYNNTLVSKVENANIEKENVDRRVSTAGTVWATFRNFMAYVKEVSPIGRHVLCRTTILFRSTACPLVTTSTSE